MGKLVFTSARQGAKYAPVIVAVIKEVRGPATDYAKATMEAVRQKRLALTKARSVRDGSLLLLLHGEQPVWVVYSGDDPVAEFPDLGVPLANLVTHADLDRRRPPEDFPSPRQRASAARRKMVAKVKIPRRHPQDDDVMSPPQDAPVESPQDRT